jgi:hypothetical protein
VLIKDDGSLLATNIAGEPPEKLFPNLFPKLLK